MRKVKICDWPIFALLAVNLVAGWFLLPNYGISWDEPLFYDYAAHIGSAYSLQNLANASVPPNAFGASSSDHQFYGPAYLLAAEPITKALQTAGLGLYQSWHWVNFLCFQVAVLCLYYLLLPSTGKWPAVFGAALMVWQPTLWGHAFINPKDIPFMAACLASYLAGTRALDAAQNNPPQRAFVWWVAFGVLLGLTSAIRVIGPLIGIVMLFDLVLRRQWRQLSSFFAAGGLAAAVMVAAWPFLWNDPVTNFIEVLRHMSNNPTELAVLYEGVVFRANAMPISYIPRMFLLMLSEPTWPLAALGVGALFVDVRNGGKLWRHATPLGAIFILLLAYILARRPSVYDGFRHFLFILPIVFMLPAYAASCVLRRFGPWPFTALVALALLPGLAGIYSTHPYEYNYYNQFAGGQAATLRRYENDYWLTCYQPALRWFAETYPGQPLAVQRELPLAKAYSLPIPLVHAGGVGSLERGSFLLTHVRANLDERSVYRNETVIQAFGLPGLDLCTIKQVK